MGAVAVAECARGKIWIQTVGNQLTFQGGNTIINNIIFSTKGWGRQWTRIKWQEY